VAWWWPVMFAPSTAGLAVAIAITSAEVVELLTTAVTVGGIVAGAFLSALWFVRVLRRLGLHVRFTQV
jgi:small neutral amino acid transporter SnatA (MarC family)